MEHHEKTIMQAMLGLERANSAAGVLETVIADFFRVYLGTENSTPEEIRDGLGNLSKKLLAQQQAAVNAQELYQRTILGLKTAGMKPIEAADPEQAGG